MSERGEAAKRGVKSLARARPNLPVWVEVLRLSCAHLAPQGLPPPLTFNFEVVETRRFTLQMLWAFGPLGLWPWPATGKWPSSAAANCSSVVLAREVSLKYLTPSSSAFALFSLPPIQPFWLFVLYAQSHLTLRGIFFILLEFPGSIVLQYPSHSHSLLIESTQTAPISVHILTHSTTPHTLFLRAVNLLRCDPPSTIFPCSATTRQYALHHLQPRCCCFVFAGQGSLCWSI
jgi:hypothetical protein